MIWFNLHLPTLRGPLPTEASATALGTWLRVMGHGCEQECGGRLRGAMRWTARQWLAACNITPEELQHAIEAKLLVADGEDLLIWGYPSQRQNGLEALRCEGAAGGAARTSAKAAAARQNGRLGGRPRVRSLETQQNPTETQRKPNETQHSKPTECELTSETGPQNPREEERKGSGVCVGFSREHAEGTTTPPPEPPLSDPESDVRWIARMRQDWPGVNLERELRRAANYTRRARGDDAPLQRRFFEQHWLPKCAEPAAPSRIAALAPATAREPEPPGWRAEIAESIYGAGQTSEVARWDQLPADVRAYVRKRVSEAAPR